MPAATTELPTVALSFANNFWGKDDAGVGPMLDRMHGAKQTCDELRGFYNARAAIEDDYARKLASLCRKPLGSQEMGSLKVSLDVMRGEVEAMAKQHANIAAQMKSELEEPLAAFAGGMKERRKIVQNGVEKLLKVKVQQTQQVNKTRDRYEQECLKIKGYLAQGHMVMGQEERKNKAKLEKTQISLATSNSEYEAAVKALEETTARWNREWKAAADKFQDLEEERLDFSKNSLWTFANVASTVCVSDDASCEKIRLSLEKLDVEKDIATFIKDRGTGQEIPDPPKYINFCRGDADTVSEAASEDGSYSVAQWPRSINPAFRTGAASPQPSVFESHHDASSALARDLGHDEATLVGSVDPRDQALTPAKLAMTGNNSGQKQQQPQQQQQLQQHQGYQQQQQQQLPYHPHHQQQQRQPPPIGYQTPQELQHHQHPSYDRGQFGTVPHDPYPLEGMTMLCRTDSRQRGGSGGGGGGGGMGVAGMNGGAGMISGPPSERSGQLSSGRPSSRDSQSDYSNPTSFSSQEPPSGKVSPVKQSAPIMPPPASSEDKNGGGGGGNTNLARKKSGFFQNHSPFRRKSTKDVAAAAANRNTWGPTTSLQNLNFGSGGGNNGGGGNQASRRPQLYQSSDSYVNPYGGGGGGHGSNLLDNGTASPEPLDPVGGNPNTSLALNVGNNVFAVTTDGGARKSGGGGARSSSQQPPADDDDPIALALAELKSAGSSGGGVSGGKHTAGRISADHYHGIATPAPGAQSSSAAATAAARANLMGHTPPPSYEVSPVVARLGVPNPAVTSRAMKETSAKFQEQTRSLFSPGSSAGSGGGRPGSGNGGYAGGGSSSQSRPGTRGNNDGAAPRATSPLPLRSVSPRPGGGGGGYDGRAKEHHRSASPNPYSGSGRYGNAGGRGAGSPGTVRGHQQQQPQQQRGSDQGYYGRHNSPGHRDSIRAASIRAASPNPYGGGARPGSSHMGGGGDMSVQLAPVPAANGAGGSQFGSQRGRSGSNNSGGNNQAMQFYEGAGPVGPPMMAGGGGTMRSRSRSVADGRQFTRDGRAIMHFARALYVYQAAIPEELGFAKGDLLAVVRHQDDGWWEATVHNGSGHVGLVPSNYLQPC